jgi:hypothetical protein
VLCHFLLPEPEVSFAAVTLFILHFIQVLICTRRIVKKPAHPEPEETPGPPWLNTLNLLPSVS